MINQMTINGVKAVITYDSDIDLFCGDNSSLMAVLIFMLPMQKD